MTGPEIDPRPPDETCPDCGLVVLPYPAATFRGTPLGWRPVPHPPAECSARRIARALERFADAAEAHVRWVRL